MVLRAFALLACVSCSIVALGTTAATAQTGTIGLNYTGVTVAQGIALNSNGGYAPPDSDGAIGPNNIVQLINGAFAVYDKSGNQQELISGRQFWINAGFDPGTDISNLGAFNGRVIYDPSSGRWIAAELSAQPTNNSVMIARSDTSDPNGGWKAVTFLGNAGGDGKFVDSTRLGVNANGVYISTTNYTSNTPDGGLDSVSIFSLPKADILAANPTAANLSRFDALDAGTVGMHMQPIINFGASPGNEPILGTSLANSDNVLFRTDVVGASAAGATLSNSVQINVAPYSMPPAPGQPDGTHTVNIVDDRFGGNVYQVGNVIYAAHTVSVGGHAGISWDKIDATTNQIIQEGILSDPKFDYFMPSIAANASGNIVIGFTRSGLGAGGNLSAYAVVGDTAGNLTTFGAPFLLKASTVGNFQYFNARWGDYSTTVVDPTNPNVFWTFQEYATSANGWATQITEITVPEPSSVAMAAIALAALAATAWRRHRLGAR